jgi:hypothetical protein
MRRISGRPFLNIGAGFLERAVQLNLISIKREVTSSDL